MKKKSAGLLIVLALMLTFGCINIVKDSKENNISPPNNVQNSEEKDVPAPNDVQSSEDNDVSPPENAQDLKSKRPKNEFSVLFNNEYFSLDDYESAIDLEGLFGKPKFEETIILGPEADTYTGIQEKTLKFPGIELLSWGKNDQNFVIRLIRVDSKDIKTLRGIGVGDMLNTLKEVYPEAEVVLDGRKDPENCAYRAYLDPSPNAMRFEVKNGEIQEIFLVNEGD